jgi:hypothetical protein
MTPARIAIVTSALVLNRNATNWRQNLTRLSRATASQSRSISFMALFGATDHGPDEVRREFERLASALLAAAESSTRVVWRLRG